MIPKRILSLLVGLMPVMLLVLACGADTPSPPAPTATPRFEDLYGVECVWLKTVVVWLDENGNGLRDDGETPLSGVAVQAVDAAGVVRAISASDHHGVADFRYEIPCPGPVAFGITEFEARTPPGYRLTTAPRVLERAEDIQFGFVRDDSTATP